MSTTGHNLVEDVGVAFAMLNDLCRAFAPDDFVADGQMVLADAVPAPANSLLVHQNHMTVELQRHYGKPVEVRVSEEVLDGEIYTRKICLALAGTSRLVESGIARVNFRHLSAAVREQILAKQTPLGAILIQHQVHRRIKPRYFMRFPAHSRVMQLLDCADNLTPVCGRLGTIYCNEEPAIELLEIVINTEVQ